jgi:glycosyltransferase involved in cell wall biosynthesis
MKRVGILALAQERHGGTLLYTRSMIEALARLPLGRAALTLYARNGDRQYDDLGVPVIRLPSNLELIARRIARDDPFRAVDRVLSPIYSPILLATRRPFAFTLHDLQEKHYPEYFSLTTRAWRHTMNRLLTARARRVVCESRFVQRDIVRHFGISASKVEVIPAPPITLLRDSKPDPAQEESVRRKFGLPGQYLLYPAQFWPHKNHLRLVEAFAAVVREFPHCLLVFTGKPRDEFARVFNHVHQLGLESKVRHIGYVEQSDLAPLYRNATAAVIPTLFESISIPIYEAFSVGTPVCASSVVALPEQVGDAGLLFDPLSVGDMTAKILSLLRDPQLRQRLGALGLRRIESITHDDYALRLSELLNDLD